MRAFDALDIDVWGGNGAYVDVFVSSQKLQLLQESFPDLVISRADVNVQELIDAESMRMVSNSFEPKKDWFEDYHRYDEIKKWYSDLATANPKLLRFVASVGQSVEGRDLFAVHLTSDKGDVKTKKQVYFQSQIHAREWISGAAVQYITNQLILEYGKVEEVTKILDTTEFIIIPIVNPDGYEYTWTNDRMWRKNRRNNGRGMGSGVDLNRNWNCNWDMDGGASRSPWSETYKGPSVASEPEVQALSAYFLKHDRIVGAIDFHSYSQLILRPPGASRTPTRHEAQMKKVSDKISGLIQDVHGKKYESIPSIDLYPTTGGAFDWFYGDEVSKKFGHHVYGFTIELRPDGYSSGGFVLPPSQIIPTGEEIYEAIKYFAKAVVEDPLD
eukprot:Partr_v1_DN26677_c5_g1_i3_m69237 putative Carboxypeptidase